MPKLSSEYRTALVTGVSSGLGRAITDMLLSEGVKVWGTARDVRRIQPFVRAGFSPVQLDLANASAARAVVDRVAGIAGGCFDLVVLNAGHGLFAPFADSGWAEWERQLSALVVGNAGVAHAVTRSMRTRGQGTLVVVTGPAGEFQAGQRMVQRALSGLAASLEVELAPSGVRVLELRCGWVRTDYVRNMPAARLTTTGEDDSRMAEVWSGVRRSVEQAQEPSRVARRLQRALVSSERRGVVNAGRSRWCKACRRLLIWMGARPRAGTEAGF